MFGSSHLLGLTKMKMDMKIIKALPIVLLFLTWNVNGQEQLELEVTQTYATFLGEIPPLRDLPPGPATDLKKRSEWKKSAKTIPNFNSRDIHPQGIENPKPTQADRARQTFGGATQGGGSRMAVEPLVNVRGLSQGDSNAIPPDPTGDIGLNYYVQSINATVYKVFDKTGEEVSGSINANTLWNEVGFSSGGDPIILFDQEVNRWLITEFAPPGQNELLVAVSLTHDPLGGYKAWSFTTPTFPDYPKYSVWSDALVVTTNEQGPNNMPSYFINKEQMYAGSEQVDIQRIVIPGYGNGPGFQIATPVDWTGNALPSSNDPIVLKLADDNWATGDADHVEVLEFSIDWADANNTISQSTKVYGEAFDTNPCSAPGPGFACIPQLDGNGIEGLNEVIMNKPEYRNFGGHESIVLNFTVDASGSNLAGIRWMELRKSGDGAWDLYQEGTYAPDDGLHRFMGTSSIDGAGNIALAYNVSSENSYPGLRFTGRVAGDELGLMTIDEGVLIEGSGANPIDRFGDYSQMSVDPVDHRTFWFTGEYRETFQYATRIAAFSFGKDSIDIGANRMLSPLNSNDLALGQSLVGEILRFEVKNYGLTPQSNFTVGYINQEGVEFTEQVNYFLAPDSVYTHTFPESVYIEDLGDYDFKFFTALPGDMALFNDTLNTIVTKFPKTDLIISGISGLPQSGCEDAFTAQLLIRNGGLETVTTFEIQTTINGETDIDVWNGSIEFGETIFRNQFINGLVPGTNDVSFEIISVNGNIDEFPESNLFSQSIELIEDPVFATMIFTTDVFPEESSWELQDENGNVLYEGGNFTQAQTEFETELCLSLSECYVLVVRDSYGDGIASGPDGSYQLVNEDGDVLAGIIEANFGLEETNAFCAELPCVLVGDVNIIAESENNAGDGIIIINLDGGVGPFQYSIDGGENFSSSNVFSDIAGGDYDIMVTDSSGDDCTFSESIDVPTCDLTLDISVGEGSIDVDANNNNGTTQYSVDGGANYQTNGLFNNLEDGSYTVVVIDNVGCAAVESVSVGVSSIGDDLLSYEPNVQILPNPNEGAFQVVVKGLPYEDVDLPFQIFGIDGRRVRNGSLAWYSGDYVGMTSIAMEPAGVYFLRFFSDDFQRVVRIIKE